ncbi:leucine-rich repeat protein 1-like isoform X1 [Homarus americanus]|uniref:leucine-rich repeat protein 1-like isoform X1 n=1 Tax=Homarus americanus TaxID=6706 RepID=UPI001C456E3A|nr:leucine-rich repeat protein 1-like isoform X1 [Homarus americanus]
MRINCEVQVNNRKLPSLNISNKRGGTRSSLGIGRHPGSKADVSSLFIHLCTAQHKLGTKYKVGGNIEAVFTKFVAEGKFTIRFKEPSHDLCVKADPVLAKTFLQTLKQGIQNKDIEKLRLSNLNPVKQSQVEKPMTKLIIRSKQEYPITTAFPYSLEILKVNNVELNRVEKRIIKLKKLKSLDLSHNTIKELPATISVMCCLTELHLSFNHIPNISPQVFTGRLSHTLHLLDLSYNGMEYLPHTLGRLCNLVSLKIDGNKLRKLPASLGKLTRMKYLTASNNNLVELPGSLMHLRMDTVDVFGNPLSSPLGLVTNNITGVPRLKEITSAYCVQRGLRPTAADIPATLVDYLQAWCKCGCGRICYETHILACISLNLKLVASALAIDTAFQTSAPALAVLCSQKCFDKCFKR